ncbi:sporulation protein [Micromonospora polyrhachis]|uniref:Sporulation-control protein spo0M n=2 Tax=Micromonospora polyrhachis TaxID=1282883 RepID=A0A7W7SPI9_9ACTN|nr:sporulation-control protein spo0M [Micromonospora polyrhachis]
MAFGGMPPGLGATGLSVNTVLTNPSTRPGLRLPGRVVLTAGSADVPVEQVVLGLVTQVEPDDLAAGRVLMEFHRVTVAGPFVVPAGQRRAVAFALAMPWETPITVINGLRPLTLRMGLRTEVGVDPMFDQGGMLPVYVHPLPAQERIFSALAALEFRLRQAGLQSGRLPGVAQTLPFHQKIGFWAPPLYAGPFSELEVTLLTNRYGVEAIFGLDRRAAMAGAGHYSLSRFLVRHTSASGGDDWVNLIDGWLRQAINRHAYAASGYRNPTPIVESAHVTHPPEDPQESHSAKAAEQGTAGGGAGIGGGGGGDGT